MKKILGLIVVIVVIGVLAVLALYNQGGQVVTVKDFKNITYVINNQSVTLVNGMSDVSNTKYFGNGASGDLNGDGLMDVAFILTQNDGGSGTFYYVVAAIRTADGYKGTNGILLGDRIAPQSTEIKDAQIAVNYADRKPTDPMTTQPSVGVTKYLKVEDVNLVEVSKSLSLSTPSGYTEDKNYTYQALGPGKEIAGVKYTIPASLAKGTNLSTDTYISVEKIPNVANCSAGLFLGSNVKNVTGVDGAVAYSFATSSEAAAGNRYDESVFAIPGTNPCVAVRYFIHSGAIGNYPKGSVKEFDGSALIREFDVIRRSLVY